MCVTLTPIPRDFVRTRTHHNTIIVVILGQTALAAGAASSDPQIAQIIRFVLVVNGQGSQLGAAPRSAPFGPGR